MEVELSRIKTKVVYKYRAYSAASLELLIKKELWLADPNDFNDPFDCSADYESAVNEAINEFDLAEINQVEVLKEFREKIEKVRVCCFCNTKKNQLMWSHYADEHKGFCIGFDKDKLLIKKRENFLSGNVVYKSISPYEDTIENFRVFDGLGGDGLNKLIINSILQSTLNTKYTNWQYEKEFRVMSTEKNVLPFRPESIKSITFGLRMEEHHKSSLKSLLASEEWKHVKWYETEKAVDRYALNFNQIC